jgi:hypothetical protein
VPLEVSNDRNGFHLLQGEAPKYLTLWLFNIAMENGPFIDDLPIKHGDFPFHVK